MKICIGCSQELDESNFYKKGGKDKDKGYQSKCKICFNNNTKQYVNRNKTQIKKYLNDYYLNNKEKIDAANKDNYKLNKKERSKKAKENYNKDKQKYLKRMKKYREDIKSNPIKYEQEKLRKREYDAEWRKKNPHIIILRNQIKNIKESLNTVKNKSLKKELGYSPLDFKQHIELQFQEGMNWNNLGLGENKWNVDHKIPISWFKKETPFGIVNHLLNLHPMWWEKNNIKSNKFSTNINNIYYKLIISYVQEDKTKLINIDR